MDVLEDVSRKFLEGNLKLSASLYQKLSAINSDNLVLSPVSVQLVLALIQLGARGKTAAELQEALHLPNSPDKLKESFKVLSSKLKSNQDYCLNAANKIYLKNKYVIDPDFFKLSREIFDAGLENLDFEEKVHAANVINKWVESKTNEKIKNLIDPEIFDECTRMVLVNALYFEGTWALPFEAQSTYKRYFFKSDNEEILVDTMHQVGYLNYKHDMELDARMLELPYKGNDITFTIVLPNQIKGLRAIESKLEQVLQPQQYSYQRVRLSMPKFKMQSSFKLIPPLKQLGVEDAFNPEESDFSGLLVNDERLMITDVIQKVFINVTESGTEAAAATAVVASYAVTSVGYEPQPIEVRVDHPFLYIIKFGNLPLFVGRLEIPTV
ncbi:hypothetical protein WA026_022077 [Henosepilachna vigintioctopunctata]|uniref:Serpin domain-containing protein n=1 Tax=Henosepilachna vigintioctopunctata TaxID=420089 RepID=A0AAW1UCK8_9CUCU